jgi:16S rRNA (guanine527-N7)-methyltransferase
MGRGPLRETGTLVTARAVAPLAELLEYVAPLTGAGGVMALPKGSGLEEETERAGAALEALGCRIVAVVGMRREISEHGRVVLVAKEGATPEQYPRREGVPGRRPITK